MASQQSMRPTSTIERPECEDPRCRCDPAPVYHCIDCASNYCTDCWPLQGPHRPGKVGRDGVPHEKTDLSTVNRLRTILQPSENLDELHVNHEQDVNAKWFGVTRDFAGQNRLKFEEYGRYSALMTNLTATNNATPRYPQLVSFIGVTNAGKSTLIKMLISRASAVTPGIDPLAWPSPIAGSVLHDSVPTSGDVNLYADPATHNDSLPILFADCEGFEGGERMPLGAMQSRRSKEDATEKHLSHVSRRIEWANTDETRQREFAVAELYPRLLYTFSDVVVFVLRNPKTFQSAVLNKLLDWGVNSLEKSLNQPALPHAIVVLNATDPGVDDREWTTEYATQSLLDSVKGALDAVDGVPKCRKLAEHWAKLGKNIKTVEDLLLRYYSSFQVIRVPAKPRYMVIDQQIAKLQSLIQSSCVKSFHAKRRARMLTNADELNIYFQAGFNHFTTHLDIPFNFVEVSLVNNPIPFNFGGHILRLATTASARFQQEETNATWLFDRLAIMLASCVMLDCARFRKGRMEDLFHNYESFFDYALAEFFEIHWPCSFTLAGRRCGLVKVRHEVKGHQDEHGILAAGDYQSSFSTEAFIVRFKEQLKHAIGSVQRDFYYEAEQVNQSEEHVPDERIALSLHREYIGQFFASVGPADQLFSHSSCFSCLMSVPEHPLPCGHVICHACLKAFGKPVGKSTIAMHSCPLHNDDTRWARPRLIQLKPEGAGIRILSLDGGGIRGIVQLEVLREIEGVLGNHFSIADFFDLIVGTGTGAIIAGALGIQQRSVLAETIDMFSALCDVAYAPRIRGMPLLKLASRLGGGSAYRTKPLRKALEMAFGNDIRLFGGTSQPRERQHLKVGMTTATSTGRNAVLLANYRRPEDESAFYEFERPHEPNLELMVWEAMAAATATSGQFKPFINEHNHRSYIDGSPRFINPAAIADRERKLIWPDVAQKDPDILLSIGTGQDRFQVLSKLAEYGKVAASREQINVEVSQGQQHKPFGFLKQAANLFTSRQEDVLEAEIAWVSFKSTLTSTATNSNGGRRYVRFNPDLDSEPPAMDNRSELRSLQQTTRKRLCLPHRQMALQHVGHVLIASCFYFEITAKLSRSRETRYGCTGNIACRFEDGSDQLRAMGKFLRTKQSPAFQPFFFVKGNETDERGVQITLSEAIIEDMARGSTFSITDVDVPITDNAIATSITLFLSEHDGLEPNGFAISGFPSALLKSQPARPIEDRAASLRSKNDDIQSIRSTTVASLSEAGSNLSSIGKTASKTSIRELTGSSPCESSSSPSSSTQASLNENTAQEDLQGTSGLSSTTGQGQRTNRFWTYIGPRHMAANPQNYTSGEIQRFAGDMACDLTDEPPNVFIAELAARRSMVEGPGQYTLPEMDGRGMSSSSSSSSARNLSITALPVSTIYGDEITDTKAHSVTDHATSEGPRFYGPFGANANARSPPPTYLPSNPTRANTSIDSQTSRHLQYGSQQANEDDRPTINRFPIPHSTGAGAGAGAGVTAGMPTMAPRVNEPVPKQAHKNVHFEMTDVKAALEREAERKTEARRRHNAANF